MAVLRSRTAPLGPLRRLPCRTCRRNIHPCAIDVDQGASADASQADGLGFSSPPAYPLYQAPQYQLAPQPAPIPPAPVTAPPAGGAPFWVWLLLGAGLMWLWSKFQELRKNPAAALLGMMNRGGQGGVGGGQDMSAMMEMMKQMQSQGGGGGFPGAAPGASPFGGMPTGGATIPTTAQDVSPSNRDGSKFEQNKQPSPAAAQPAATEAPASAQPPAAAASGSASSFFTDASATATPQGAASSTPSSFFSDTGVAQQGGAASPQGSAATETLIENMLQMVVDNPELQKQMNNFLPANMRDENTWKWIASNPDLRKQIAKQMAPNFNPEAMSSFTQQTGPSGMPNPGGADMDKAMEEMRAQGVDPSNYMSEMMADPEVMELFMKPHVTEALMEIQKNPQSAVNYMSDPDVSKLMSKMMTIQSKVGGPMPGMSAAGMPAGGIPGVPAGGAIPDMTNAAGAAAPSAAAPAGGTGTTGGHPPGTPAASEAVPQTAATKKA